VTFAGDVREHDDGRIVIEIEYVAYSKLALNQLLRILNQAEERWRDCRCAAAHRTGMLRIGETSVGIAVASAHRAEAFEACRWIIDAFKTELPIWKRERFESGDQVWIEGDARVSACAPESDFADENAS
jgi:molybdopterin synthase catalytic subunit